ncbi:sulfocyanin-like copper-binding protein [Actinocrinis sp.]|uniref:sulfocyanin-like copper-binding protein n=1 Tax=Actinocrinis sp. TaxID=1920516 RepID=UPI002D69E522|nr:sulfocyanin-like copper-binding protein [Actinocrinis sp.]HZP51765.1 sulfocyanin-like copper-binding protein [Actinocrinis sp.]
MKRTTKLAAVLTVGATTAIGVVIATGPVSAAAGGNGGGSTRNGTGGYSTMMGSGTSGRGGMMGNRSGNGTGTGSGIGSGMMGSFGAFNGNGMGTMMGRVLANASGSRVSSAEAAAAADAIPPGASVDAARNRLTFTGDTVTLTLVAGADEKNSYTFEAAGLTNPQIIIPAGARVTLRLINADADMAHGVLVTATSDANTSWMPMMTATAAFSSSAIWALGAADSSGAPTATTSFSATTPGTYTYLCPVPSHAQQGMYGAFTVR